MENATQILRKEHDAILRMLEATERAAGLLDQRAPVAPSVLKGLLEFFRLFADRCHQGKEEDLLFPLLEKKGIRRSGGPIGTMLVEHDHGRWLIQQMTELADAYARGESTAGGHWAQAAHQYSALLRDHIARENDVLFMRAERVLSEHEMAQLAKAFEEFEARKMGAGAHERLYAQMDKLISEIVAVPPAC